MSKQQREAIDAALRAAPFNLGQSTAEHRKSFDAFAIRLYPAGVGAVDVSLGGVGTIELTVAGNAADAHLRCAVARPRGGTRASLRPRPSHMLPGRGRPLAATVRGYRAG
jgi:hypothetical protein